MNGQLYDVFFRPLEAAGLSELRAELLAKAWGKTLEIGMGTGLNLTHYPDHAEVTGIEPDQSMREKSLKRGARVLDGDAMNLAFPDHSFDTVVGTLVFCTIPDPDKAIQEVFRVLKPGGKLLLLEHVRRNTPIAGRFLDGLTPIWKHLADGCHLNRDPGPTLQKTGFKTEEFRQIWAGLGKIWVLIK